MQQFFVEPSQINEYQIKIEGSDVNHIRNVLRMRIGEEICISNGKGQAWHCRIRGIEKHYVDAEILSEIAESTELPSRICLFQGLPKSDKMDLIVQKAVELGVDQIIPVKTKRAVVKLDRKKEDTKRKRWNSIAESAAAQSGRMHIPEVGDCLTFKEALAYAENMDCRLIPYELAEGMAATKTCIDGIKKGQTIGIFIGPEGGFEEAEIEQARSFGVRPITLGKRILRTETAGLMVLSVLMYHLEGE